MLAALVALSLAADPGVAPREEDSLPDDELATADAGSRRLRLGGWGGTIFDLQDRGTIPFGGAELSWALDQLDVGVLAQAYRFGRERARSEWGPVVLARLGQRFETRRGLEATVGLGIGAGRERSWAAWFQFTAGFRLVQGPLFLGGELGFEQDRFFRLGATLGLAVF